MPVPKWATIAVFALFILLLLVVFGGVFNPHTEIGKPNAVSQSTRRDERAWRPIGRLDIMSGTYNVPRVYGGTIGKEPSDSQVQIRFTMRGSFAASEPLTFVVIDAANVQRMQSGYPPIIQYSARPGQPIQVPWPAVGSFYGFIRPAPESTPGIPTSLSELALRLIGKLADENRPPVKLTAELWADGECLCTEAEAAARMKPVALPVRSEPQAPQPIVQRDYPPAPPSGHFDRAEVLLAQPQDRAINQARAVSNVIVLRTAIITYCHAYNRAPASLSELETARLINSDLASGETSGYSFSLHVFDCKAYGVGAEPVTWNSTGSASFYLDAKGNMHTTRENRPAWPSDPVLGGN